MTDACRLRASVVIPTYNRLRDLDMVVRAVGRQIAEIEGDCEIVVVDDGSTDGTGEWLDLHASELSLEVVHQVNSGPARARNRGVAAARGELLLFLGDDTEPQDGWLLEHLEVHRLASATGPTAVVGYTSFPVELDSPFLRWINEYGAQFGYSIIDDPTAVPFNFFYTSNVSLPLDFFNRLGGFREDFPAAAWEDIEFAYRAAAAGLRLRYQPRARCIHHHSIDVGSFCARQRKSGGSAAIFAGLHPELEGFLGVPCVSRKGPIHRLFRRALRGWVELGEQIHGMVPGAAYRRLLDGHYLQGLSEGLDSRGVVK
jgi:GT2 family glycosyltransferase